MRVESRCLIQVFESSQKVDIDSRLDDQSILDLIRQDVIYLDIFKNVYNNIDVLLILDNFLNNIIQ